MKRIGYIDGRRIAGFTFPATLTPGNGIVLTIVDPSIIASGDLRGVYINYTASGVKTGGFVTPLGIRLAVTENTPYAYGMRIHTVEVANKTMEYLIGLEVDMNDAGNAVSRFFAFNVDMKHNTAPAGETGFMRFRNSGTLSLDSIFQIESVNPATHLLSLTRASLPYHSSNVNVEDGRVGIKIEGTTKYFKVYAS